MRPLLPSHGAALASSPIVGADDNNVSYFLLFQLVLRPMAEGQSPTLTVFKAPRCSGGSTGSSGMLLVPRLERRRAVGHYAIDAMKVSGCCRPRLTAAYHSSGHNSRASCIIILVLANEGG